MSMSREERAARRQAYRDRATALANRQHRSETCANPLLDPSRRHVTCIGHTEPDRCLCECHDPEATP